LIRFRALLIVFAACLCAGASPAAGDSTVVRESQHQQLLAGSLAQPHDLLPESVVVLRVTEATVTTGWALRRASDGPQAPGAASAPGRPSLATNSHENTPSKLQVHRGGYAGPLFTAVPPPFSRH
jgi:hypothetical protein